MHKHTPGPWKIFHQFNVFHGERLIANCGGHSSNVNIDKVHEENVSNALLVAAAPKLLKACCAALSWHGLDGDGISDPVRKQLIAAIFSATKTRKSIW